MHEIWETYILLYINTLTFHPFHPCPRSVPEIFGVTKNFAAKRARGTKNKRCVLALGYKREHKRTDTPERF